MLREIRKHLPKLRGPFVFFVSSPHADKRFIGLVHSVLSSAQAALGEDHSPMTHRLAAAGIEARSPRAVRAAERSLALLEMLQRKTHGNLDETERDALVRAIGALRDQLGDAPVDGATTGAPGAVDGAERDPPN